MSAADQSIANKIIFNKLSYDSVLDSDASLKSWISSHNEGIFAPFINGEYSNSDKDQLNSLFSVTNPFSGSVLAKFVNCDKPTLDKAIESGLNAANDWKNLSYIERGRIIYKIARNVQKHLQILTSCESVNSGRTSREVKDLDLAQVVKTLYYYSGSLSLETSADLEPVGLVAIFGYYDSSLLSLVNKLAPALASGNTCLVIPHKLTPMSAFMLLDICVQSGMPSGVINLVASAFCSNKKDKDDIFKWVSAHQKINCVCFDGRANIGQELIVPQCSIYPNKQTILSLEGKSSMVIYESADIDSSIEAVVDGCFYSNGQHRYSLNKLFVQECVYNNVLRRLENRFKKIRTGNHLDKCNDFGVLVNNVDTVNYRQGLSNQITEFGAEVQHFEQANLESVTSDSILFPTIIKNIPLNSQFNLSELNGPYLMVVPFRTVKESVELINNSKYGCGVCLYSQNISLVMEVSYLLNAGTVWINSFPLERGVQTRRQSGNFHILGQRSLRQFLRSKWELKGIENIQNFDQVSKSLKTFGSLSPASALPQAQNLNVEKTYKLYIGGKQQRPDTQSSRAVLNPKTNETYCLVADASRKDVRNAVEAANSAFNGWWKRTNFNKAQIIYYFGENFSSRSAELTDKLSIFTQRTKEDCQKEIQLCSDLIFYFAALCDKYVGKLNDTTDYGYLMQINEPLGCIAIICGHNSSNDNYPLFTFVQHLIGAIAHGNTVVIVPDERLPIPALDLYEIFDTSDMPGGVVNILTGNKHHLAKYLCEHQQVSSIWYLHDVNESNKLSSEELTALQFIKYTSNFSLKNNWIVPCRPQLNEKNNLNRDYLNNIGLNSTQSKYVHIPMGIIFAN